MIDIFGEKKEISSKNKLNKNELISFVPIKSIQDNSEEKDRKDADNLIDEIESTSHDTLEQKEIKETSFIKSELIKNFNQYVDGIKIDVDSNVVSVDEIKTLAKNVFKSVLPQMIESIQKGGKHEKFYEFMLSTFEKQFYVLIDKKLSGLTGRATRKLASKELFEKNKNIIKLKVSGMMNDMMMSVIEPLGYKLSYEMKNYDLSWSVSSIYYCWGEYWTLKKMDEFFNKLNKKVYNELFK